jgi:beta-N-acetylhexosaminidase
MCLKLLKYTAIINAMTLEEKVGQLFIVGHWDGVSATQTAVLIKKEHVGGVIIMSSPQNPDTISQWTSQWRSTSTYPLTIAIDQEGGSVTRLQSSDYTQLAQPDISSTEEAFAIGKQRADELTALGINTDFAPVLETSTNTNAFLYNRFS